MFEAFEPAEKKLELRLRAGRPSLRSRGVGFWAEVVKAARAEVVLTRETTFATSFLLSESSLFVFDRRLVMITCGRSALVGAALRLVEALGPDALDALAFTRRREERPGAQLSTFQEDVHVLLAVLSGEVFSWGPPGSPSLQAYVHTREGAEPAPHASLELFMHAVAEPEAGHRLELGGFETDEHHFEPAGYSMNAVGPDAHRALHVTPTLSGSYAGLDASDPDPAALDRVMDQALSRFRPAQWSARVRRAGRSPLFLDSSGAVP